MKPPVIFDILNIIKAVLQTALADCLLLCYGVSEHGNGASEHDYGVSEHGNGASEHESEEYNRGEVEKRKHKIMLRFAQDIQGHQSNQERNHYGKNFC